MKTCSILLAQVFLCVALSYSGPYSEFSAGTEPKGFRGLDWGTARPVSGMTYFETDPSYGGVKRYKRASDDLTIGSATLSSICYDYWDGRLCGVFIQCKGLANFNGLRDALKEKFGSGYKADYSETRYWDGSITTILLKYNELSEIATVWFSSKAIALEQEAWEKAKAKEANDDF